MSAPDLISRAARFFVLAEQAPRFWFSTNVFLELSAPPVVEAADHLPAMAAAVRREPRPYILETIPSSPFPDVLPPEAVPWHSRLVAAWEVHRASRDERLQNVARLALVRLDGCGMPDGHERPSRLPEWLVEAQKIASGHAGATGRSPVPYRELEALAALAAWRPAPRVLTPPETLREWGNFWMKLRRSRNPVKKGLAAIALLNLPEADLRAASISPVPGEQLLQELRTAIPVAVGRMVESSEDYLLLLDWQPATGTIWPATEVRKVADAWLEITRHRYWGCSYDAWLRLLPWDPCRYAAWRQLIRWGWAGRLAICGIDLLPELVKAVPTENDTNVLWAMAQWLPTAELSPSTGTPGRRSLLEQLEGAWKRHRMSWFPRDRASAWLAGIRLHQAGLAAEPPESFLEACLATIADEPDPLVLFILAQWSPGTEVPGTWYRAWLAAWQHRLMDKDERIQRVAAWAFLRQFLEKASDRSPRGVALELWRAGVKVSPEARHILGAAFARFQEVRALLAAGEVVDFEAKPARPSEQCRLPLALPPGRIAGGEWQMENEKWKMENEAWRMKHQKVTPQPNLHLWPDSPSRSGMGE